MLVSEFYTHVNYALRGTDDEAPTHGTGDAPYWLATLNRKKNELYGDATKNWGNIWEVREQGTISASAAPSVDLDEEIIAPSDTVYVVDSNDIRTDFKVVKPQERNRFTREVYIAGFDPQVLYFTNAIAATEDIVGATLFVPGYWMPEDLESANDTLPFLDPYWAVMAVAAEIAGNDLIYEDKEENLTRKANALFDAMVLRNQRGTYGNPRTTPTRVNRIRGTGDR